MCCSYTYNFRYLVFHADRKQYPWSSKLEEIAFPALFPYKTEISCKRLTDAFLYPVKVSLKFSSERKQKLASQSPQPKWVILSGNCTLVFRASEAGQYCFSMTEAYPSPTVRNPAVPQHSAHYCSHGPADQTRAAIHFGQGDRIKCTLKKTHFFQKSHKKHKLWYLTQNKMDLNMYDWHFLKYLLF